ncbi:MAG: ABC transporter permease [Actinomycetes bacterium]
MASAYRALLGSRLAAQVSYRASFVTDVASQVWLGAVDLAEILVIFTQVRALGGLDVQAALVVYALATVGFSLADALVGHLDDLPVYVRSGRLDVLLLRPLPLLAQVVLEDLSLRRLGRALTALVVLAVVLTRAPVDWTLPHVALLVLSPLVGCVVFSAIFVAGSSIAFWVVEGREFSNAFTYCCHYVAEFPLGALAVPLRRFFTFVVPAAFTAYLPAVAILDLPEPTGLSPALVWLAPAVAAAAWLVALLVWRAGVRRYTGAGS